MNRRFASLVLWLVLQSGVLAMAAGRLPLFARSGSATQRLALPEMIVAQIALSTMLFPLLMRDDAMAIALVSIPFVQLSGMLSGIATAPLLAISSAIVLWILALGRWANVLGSPERKLIGVAILNCCVIGVPIANYLNSEFADPNGGIDSRLPAIFDPIAALIRQSTSAHIGPATVAAPLALLVSGAGIGAWKRYRPVRARLSTVPPQP